MGRKRLSRKELVQKDEITTTLETITAFLLQHRKRIGTSVGVVVAGVVIFVAWNVYAANLEANSQNELSEVIAIYTDTDRFDSNKVRFEAVLAEAQELRDNYPNLPVSQIAEYYMALSYEGLDNSDESLRILRNLIDSGDEAVKDVARFALGEFYKTHGDFEAAVIVFKELIDTEGYTQGAVLFELGSLHESLSKFEEARSYYQSIVSEYPDSPFRSAAERASERLLTDEIEDKNIEP